MGRYLKIVLAMVFCVVSSQQEGCSISISNNQVINVPNLAVHTGQLQGNCCNICQNTPGCKGFVFNDEGTCWLKAEIGAVTAKDGVNVGIVYRADSDAHDECSIMANKEINLTLFTSRYEPNQENCCSICRNTSGCKGFSWNTYEGGTCWLKAEREPFIDEEDVGIMRGNGCSDNTGGDDGDTVNGGDYQGALVSYDEFANAVVNSNGYPRPNQAQYNAFIQGLPKGLIASKQEAAMALTHFLHESDGLRAKREYRCVNNGCPGEYETPGCDAPAQHYFGRGYIQLTWCFNYRAASHDLFNDNRLISDPDMVARDENLAWNTAFWFWKMNVHNVLGVAEGDFGVTTRAINGKLECDNSAGHAIARRRYAMYGKIRAAWGLPGPGIERGCYN